MPWSKDDYPNSMKNLDPKIREKAISIAEAMRKSGSSEGLAIATGIKKAKGLVKLAFLLPLTGTIIGANLGAKVGKDKKTKSRNAKIGALTGFAAGVGGNIALNRHLQKMFRQSGYQYRNRYNMPPPPKKMKTNIESFFKEQGVDHTNIKTKLEAKKIYRSTAQKHHPDLGGSEEKMKKLNTDWEGVENSSWFNKLAMIMKRLKNESN